ncbi:MAG TPA: ABC transporter ATP-binding protein [Frankiaceae bacterium]|nr:ABC transporter ATP-binding protein [Frankiaceae bacterium]
MRRRWRGRSGERTSLVWNSFYRRGDDGSWTAWVEPLPDQDVSDDLDDVAPVIVAARTPEEARKALIADVLKVFRESPRDEANAFRDRHAVHVPVAESPPVAWPPSTDLHSTMGNRSRFAAEFAEVLSPSGDIVLSFRHVWKKYGRTDALRGVSFDIRRGEVVAFLGPNGAGKSTAVNLMVGLRRPSRGIVTLFGDPPNTLAARSRLGVMLQECGLPATLKVREIVDLFRSYYPHPMDTDEVLAIAGLGHKADTRIDRTSRGERQRVYFAIAICGDPEILFLDEPTTALDVEARQAFLTSIRAFAALGKTILLTTHYLEEAEAVSDRIIVVNRGRVVADASPAQIKHGFGKKRVTFVAGRIPRPAVFRGLPIVRLEQSRRDVSLLTDQPEAVLHALFDRGVTITDLEVTAAGLQEVFLSLVDGTSEEGGRSVA